MRIGLDFDNTIVSYDALFHKVAREQGVVPVSVPVSKVAVRDHLRTIGKENVWTEMQGYVYGSRMNEAESYPGVIDFFWKAGQAGHRLAIISHKTQYPFIGPKYDLHNAARNWIRSNLVRNGVPLLSEDDVYFELTKESKLARIQTLACDLFIDDLPEILSAPGFPADTQSLLFDPDDNHSTQFETHRSWAAIADSLGLK